MMTLQEMKKAVDQLSPEERAELREYLEERRRREWAESFDAAVDALQEGLSREEVEAIKQAINTDSYIEDVDLDQWRE